MQKKEINWSSLVGWGIFVLIIAGGPLMNFLQSVLGIALPSWTLAALVALLMLVSAAVSIGQAFRRGSDSGDATKTGMPPFGEGGGWVPRFGSPPSRTPTPTAQPSQVYGLPPVSLPKSTTPTSGKAPRFEPVVSPMVIGLGVVGLVILVALGMVLFGGMP